VTTLNLQVGASGDDAHETHNNSNYSSIETYVYGQSSTSTAGQWSGGFRFLNVTIPKSDTINAATMQVDVLGTAYDDPNLHIRGDNVDNSAAWSSTDSPFDRDAQLTSASVTWSVNGIGAGWSTTPEIKTVIQEIVNRAGWSSGNALSVVFRARDNTFKSFRVVSYDGTAANAAKLDIDHGLSALPERQYPRGVMRGVTRGTI
jgi:hypothetical protein